MIHTLSSLCQRAGWRSAAQGVELEGRQRGDRCHPGPRDVALTADRGLIEFTVETPVSDGGESIMCDRLCFNINLMVLGRGVGRNCPKFEQRETAPKTDQCSDLEFLSTRDVFEAQKMPHK